MELRPMETAPKDGSSIQLKTNTRVLQACWFDGRWREEKDWQKAELSQPEPEIRPVGWLPLSSNNAEANPRM